MGEHIFEWEWEWKGTIEGYIGSGMGGGEVGLRENGKRVFADANFPTN